MEIKDLKLVPTFKQKAGELDKKIRETITSGFYGVSTYAGRNEISIWIDETLTEEDIKAIKVIVGTFDPETVPVEPPVILPEDVIFKGELREVLIKLEEVSIKNEMEIKEVLKQLLFYINNRK